MKHHILTIAMLIWSGATILAEEPTDSITLNETLGEVTVTAQRKFTRPTSRGIKISMAGNPLSKIGSAIEAIKQMPMIDASSGGISVLGKGGNQAIYINGKLMRNSSELDMLSSEDLESVEIITNPSSKYGTEISAVILIKTKKKNEGFYAEGSGKVTAAEEWSENGQVSMNYHTEKGITLFGDMSYGSNGFKQKRDYREKFATAENMPFEYMTHTLANAKSRSQSLTADGGIDYTSGKNSAGVKYTFSRTPSNHFSYHAKSLSNVPWITEDITSTNNLNTQSFRHYMNGYADISLPFDIGMRIDLDYISGKNSSSNITVQEETTTEIFNHNKTGSKLAAGKIEFTRNFGDWEINAGADYTYTYSNQSFTSRSNSEDNNMLRPATDRVKQNLASGYLSADYRLNDKWKLSGGIRYEHTNINYVRNGEVVADLSNNYQNLHPNIGFTFSSPVTVSVYYKTAIFRPSYSSLENNYVYVTPTLWETGNPALKSMVSHDINASLYYKKFILIVNGSHYKRKIGTTYNYDPEIKSNVTTTTNLPSYSNLQIVAIQNFDYKFWHPTLQGLLYMQNLKYGTPERKYTHPLYRVILNNRFDIPGGFYAYLSFHLLGTGDIETQYSRGMWQAALTLNKSHKNWTFSLYANDIFGSWRQRFDTNTNLVCYSSDIKGASQYVSLSIRYKLNIPKGKYKGRSVREDEINRL